MEDALERTYEATERAPAPQRDIPKAHITRTYPVTRPYMTIGGAEPTEGFVLRVTTRASAIQFENTNKISVQVDNKDPKTLPLEEARKTLSQFRLARIRIVLQNAPQTKIMPRNWQAITRNTGALTGLPYHEINTEPVTTAYDFDVKIASAAELSAVEAAFDKHLSTPNFTMNSVSQFLADHRCTGAATDYARGMAEYATGVLAKEGQIARYIEPSPSQYRNHFVTALEIFAQHQRALPTLLSGFIRFSLNDFTQAGAETGNPLLDAATATLAGPTATIKRTPSSERGKTRSICPIDHGTDRILRLAEHLAAAERWSQILHDECKQVASANSIALEDKNKAYALWGLAAIRLGARRDADEPLSRISATYPFNAWAPALLDPETT